MFSRRATPKSVVRRPAASASWTLHGCGKAAKKGRRNEAERGCPRGARVFLSGVPAFMNLLASFIVASFYTRESLLTPPRTVPSRLFIIHRAPSRPASCAASVSFGYPGRRLQPLFGALVAPLIALHELASWPLATRFLHLERFATLVPSLRVPLSLHSCRAATARRASNATPSTRSAARSAKRRPRPCSTSARSSDSLSAPRAAHSNRALQYRGAWAHTPVLPRRALLGRDAMHVHARSRPHPSARRPRAHTASLMCARRARIGSTQPLWTGTTQ